MAIAGLRAHICQLTAPTADLAAPLPLFWLTLAVATLLGARPAEGEEPGAWVNPASIVLPPLARRDEYAEAAPAEARDAWYAGISAELVGIGIVI